MKSKHLTMFLGSPRLASLIDRFARGGVWDSLLSSALLTPLGTLFQFALTVAVARTLDVAEFGSYSYSLQIASFIAIVAGGGLPVYAQKLIPEMSEGGKPHLINEFFTWSLLWVLLCTLILLTAVAIFPALRENARYYGIAISIIPIMLWLMQFYTCLGYNRISLGLVPRDLVTPVLIIVVLQFYQPSGAVELLGIYNAVLVLAVVAGMVIVAKSEKIRLVHLRLKTGQKLAWLRGAYPMAVTSLAQLGLNTLDLVVLGILSSMANVGAYAACLRLALAVSILNRVLGIAVGHKLSALIATSQFSMVWRVYKESMAMSAVSGVVLFCIILLFGDQLLLLFGSEYATYHNVLIILSIGNFISSLIGPVIVGHNMIGNQGYIARSQLTWMLIALALYFLVIPFWSLVGAATVTAITQSLMKFMQLYRFHQCLARKNVPL